MLIKDDNEEKLYFLAHLDRYYKNVGDKVYPGMEVALCGNTGNSTGAHLHVEVRLCTFASKDEVLDSRGNKRNPIDYTDGDISDKGDGLKWSMDVRNKFDERGLPRVDPFDHDKN